MSMKRNGVVWLTVGLSLLLLLAACGEKSQEKVVAKLESNLEAMSGYKTKAEMTMKTGQEDQKYKIDIWHKKEDYYRVALANDEDEKGSQVILKNKDGVFVLTPALNKSFKFQSEWPENGSQPYLYQSLVADIIKDSEATFEVSDTHYVFHTKTNYQSNNNLPYQEIYIDKKTYTPVLVKVLDKDSAALVEVAFTSFDMDPELNEDDFLLDQDLASEETLGDEAETDISEEEEDGSLAVTFPLTTVGAEMDTMKEVSLENGKRIIMTFTGGKNFTLVQEKVNAVEAVSTLEEKTGDVVNLGFTIGAISENRLEWTMDGVDFYLASDDLTRQELIDVAQSVRGQEVK